MQAFSYTDTGKTRKKNEDSVYLATAQSGNALAIVADGMGGHNAGEIASRIAIETVGGVLAKKLEEEITLADIEQACGEANRKIFRQSYTNAEYMGMGTTLTLAAATRERISIGHVGDSRAYLLTKKGFQLLTRDHSFVQELLEQGLITPEQAESHPQKNLITRAVGTAPELRTDLLEQDWDANDILLLCTDGLTRHLSGEEIERTLREDNSLQTKVEELSNTAMCRGGLDNISVILLQNAD